MKKIILLVLCILLGPMGWAQDTPPAESPKAPVQSSVTTSKPTPVNKKEFRVYPNPSNGIIHIILSGFRGIRMELRILNVIGNEVHREVFNEMSDHFTKTLDLSKRKSGLYYVKLEADDFSEVRKVILN